MRSTHRVPHIVSTVLLSAVMAVSTAAWSQSRDPQEIAREHYQRGKQLYDAGNYAESLIEFQAAYDTKPHPIVLKSISECKVQLGDVPGAIELLNRFLDDPTSQGKEEVHTRIEELKKLLAVLEITSEPGGAYITIDGEPTRKSTPAVVEVGKGDHQIILIKDGYEPLLKDVSVAEGEKSLVAVDFSKEGQLTPQAKKEADLLDPFEEEKKEEEAVATEPEKRKGPHPVFWVCAAATGVGLVGGTVFGAMALGDEDEYNKTPTKKQLETGERNALIADISFGVAAAAAIAGTIVLITLDGKEEPESSAKKRFNITPVAGDHSVGVNTTVTF